MSNITSTNNVTPTYRKQSVVGSAVEYGALGGAVGAVCATVKNRDIIKTPKEFAKSVLKETGKTAGICAVIGIGLTLITNALFKNAAKKYDQPMNIQA